VLALWQAAQDAANDALRAAQAGWEAERPKLVCGLLVIAATYSLTVRAEADYDGQYARNIGITYQVGGNNSVVGQITNNTHRTVYVSAAFKCYAADGHVSQGGQP